MKKGILATGLLLVLAACGAKTEPAKRYSMHGEIKGLDPAAKTATIKAGKIGDWMEAMTMEYPIRPDGDFSKLHVGDQIDATVVVGDKYYVTEVKVEPPK